ncbi:MAG: hypothetical protein L3J11_05740, partial [Draconibacterium sp.]|nr:hypothetical protein [Draconibacterium sp.]
MNLIQKIFLSVFLFTVTCTLNLSATEPPFLQFKNDNWVNTQLNKLTLKEKIAQLMMVAVYPKQNEASKAKIIDQIKTYKPGGILIMQGTPVKTAQWINQFQKASATPLLVAIDGEWGLKMRIDSTMIYPFSQAIGAVQDTTFVYKMGRDFGKQLKQMGIHINFAPDA